MSWNTTGRKWWRTCFSVNRLIMISTRHLLKAEDLMTHMKTSWITGRSLRKLIKIGQTSLRSWRSRLSTIRGRESRLMSRKICMVNLERKKQSWKRRSRKGKLISCYSCRNCLTKLIQKLRVLCQTQPLISCSNWFSNQKSVPMICLKKRLNWKLKFKF